MAVDLRLALQEQGQDPRKIALVAFGGAGPLHAARVARSVGVPVVLVPAYPGLNCALGMLQTNVRHSYLKSQVGRLSQFPASQMNEIFDGLEGQAYEEAKEEGFPRDAVRLTRLLDLRYPHQGYTLPVACPKPVDDAGRGPLKSAFDALHQQVYGQSAPKEDAEIVTFRIQSEIEVAKLSLPKIEQGSGDAGAVARGSRPLFDVEKNVFVDAGVYDRAKLKAGDRIKGPAIIEQFDSTTVMLAGQVATVDDTGTLVLVDEVTVS
jgi:N-methylhydantoinase A